MSMNGFKVIAAYDQNIPVSGIYIRKIGTFTVNKGIAPITVDQYEYAFNFRVNGRSYRSMFGKESDYGKVGADGKWQSWALEKAVEARLRFEKNAINGVRPTSVKEERELNWKAAEDKKRQEQQEKTVEELVNLFLIDISNTGPGIKTNAPRTINEHRLNLKRDVVPVIGERKAKKITRRDISAILGTIAQRGAFVQSNRTKSSCCRLFNWAVDKDWVPYNPCANMSKYVEKPRERVLTEEEPKEDTGTPPSHKEIKTLCLKLMEHRELPEARILLLCILLGSREGEICNMYWENIDNQNWLTIHPDKTKTDVELACFLTPTASDLLGAKRKKGLIFTLKTKSDQAFSVNNLSKFVRDNEYFGLSPWQPRDLRRTFTTLAKSFNASNFIVNLAQARKDDSVLRKHYDKRRYYKELKELFLTIEQEILRITSQEN